MTPDCRSELVERLRTDLLGPDDEGEQITDMPSDRYLTGILFPQKTEIPGEEQEELQATQSSGGSDGGDDGELDAAGLFLGARPASAGFSFAVESQGAGPPELDFLVSCGTYARLESNGGEGASGVAVTGWKRTAHSCAVPAKLSPGESWRDAGLDGLRLYLRIAVTGTLWTVTATLVNTNESSGSKSDDEARSFFQIGLTARCRPGTRFAPRPSRRHATDDDGKVAELIYRDSREYAVGHTCSVEWKMDGGGQVETISTSWIPEATVFSMSAAGDSCFDVLRKEGTTRPLSASWLATAGDKELVAGLRLLVNSYSGWVESQQRRVPSLPAELQDRGRKNVEICREGANRMLSSIALLEKDAASRTAFRLAQQAIVIQRRWVRKEEDLTWRPFQLGFQLLALESLAVPGHPGRQTMDLLWFPTGGGKTEAYLALTAFILMLRRLRGTSADEGRGVAVLMRYTLRLLTIQQFQRASALILACEYLRRGRERPPPASSATLGTVPFAIGLWVGGGATPNSFDDARTALNGQGGGSTPRQLVDCPCCSGQLAWTADPRAKKILVECRGKSCQFAATGKSLPVWTVDSDVYAEQPSLVIATVDKFAQITRNPSTAALFGLAPLARAPDLIIQDELHLISGPLGTLTGIYETAIDFLCTRGAVRPKIIGSTATIRRASEQIRGLFDRDTFQFPPPCIDASNSGFAVEDRKAPGRRYVGISTVGRSPKFTLQASCASLLQGVEASTRPVTEKDPYWTLVAYFNSLRELGGAVVLMLDDVPASVQMYARRHGDARRRNVGEPVELTSRAGSDEIPEILKDLLRDCSGGDAVDVLLASNMISVGVDIPRLGVMVVNGQPKTIAEYIQSTSRVGREKPGLVVTVENHGRVRDRSHFETFATWHETLYREVEATSVTPFASRARDKALPAVLVGMARHLVSGMMGNPRLDAATVARMQPILEEIKRRAASVATAESAGVAAKLRVLIEQWSSRKDLTEYWKDNEDTATLLMSAEQVAAFGAQGVAKRAWAAPNSMREVEPGTPYQLKERISGGPTGTGGASDGQ
jgi:hypothetical protein